MLRFGSNIYLVSKSDFAAIVSNRKPDYAKWSYDTGDGSIHAKSVGYTDDAYVCSIFHLSAPQSRDPKGSLFHFFAYSNFTSIQDSFVDDELKELDTDRAHAKGILTGGSTYSEQSRQIYDLITDILRRSNSDGQLSLYEHITRIWGRKDRITNSNKGSDFTDFFFDVPLDSWCLSCESIETGEDILTREELCNAYEDVYIAPGDKLITPQDPQYNEGIRKLKNAERTD